ncbi:MAG TPA: hypothetical protein VGF97_00135 [Rhizomicrobium sp.]|jgi:hypothetical protein
MQSERGADATRETSKGDFSSLLSSGPTISVTGDPSFRRAVERGDVSSPGANEITPKQAPDEAIRPELVNQIEAARAELETQLRALRDVDPLHSDPQAIGQGEAGLSRLNALRDQLAGGVTSVTALRAAVVSAVADTRTYTSGLGAAMSSAQAAATAQVIALAQSSEAARATTASFMDDYYHRRIFDPYLKFTSTEDEDTYRSREAERQRLIEKAQAENTPEGTLRATRLSIEQLKDAGAHGADKSPDFRPTMRALKQAESDLGSKLPSAGNDKEAGDRLSVLSAGGQDTSAAQLAPDAIAALRKAGVVTADQKAEGHGVSFRPASQAVDQSMAKG